MPVITPIENPFGHEELSSAWVYARVASFDFGTKNGRIVYEAFSDREAAYSGKAPIKTIEVILGTPAEYGSPPLISPGTPAVYETVVIREPGTDGPEDPGEYATVEVSPAVDPVYGEAPVIRPAIPSLNELIADNQAAYAALQGVVDNLALGLPEFAGGAIEG